MKISKIKMIEEPRRVLNSIEMSKVVGGELCTSYDDSWWHDDCTGTYASKAPCLGGDGLYCTSYKD